MKFIAFLILLFSVQAIAETPNPFDTFVGDYTVVGAPRIKNVRKDYCERYRWKDLQTLNVKPSGGLYETHQIRFVAGPKESMFQVQEFHQSNDVASTGSFAETSGGEDWATSARGSWSYTNKQHAIVTLMKTEGNYRVTIKDESYGAGTLRTGCYYEADLIRNLPAFTQDADPFDAFLGTYAIEGKPRIKEVGTNYCLLYSFGGLTGITVKPGDAKFESHMVHFISTYKSVRHSVMNYETRNDRDTAGSLAVTSGGEGWAANVRGTWSIGNKSGVRIRLKQTERGAVVALDDETLRSGVVKKACYYEADLVKVAE